MNTSEQVKPLEAQQSRIKQPIQSAYLSAAIGWGASSLGLGLVLLILSNAVLCISQPFAKVDPSTLPATHTWTWWATQEYLHDTPTPSIVLMGSSLFMHPVSREDADFIGHSFDYVHHHYSTYLGSQLQKRFNLKQAPICFNFALPGDIVSDNYMIARGLFRGNHRPEYVILGLSLRDFIDNAVNCPGTTPPFRYLQRFTSIDDIASLAFPQFWQRFDYFFGQYFYPWAKKLDLQALAAEQTKNLLGDFGAKLCSPCLLNELDYHKHVPANLHSEVEEGMDIIQPRIPDTFDANCADYIRRYGTNKGDKYLWMFNIQKQFFCKLVALCKQEKIKLVIVNMPLTKENMDLMPKDSYQRYLTLVNNEAQKYQFPFIDLNENPRFTHSDFYDTAHMNSTGGKKMLDLLSNL